MSLAKQSSRPRPEEQTPVMLPPAEHIPWHEVTTI